MHTITYPIRIDHEDKRLFEHAARAEGISLAEFIRRAAREKARPVKREPACFKYLDEIQTPAEALKNPKAWIGKKILEKK
ncbi:MAG: DUF1778 domain-containing protein [Verrucomicrobiota bacterium]